MGELSKYKNILLVLVIGIFIFIVGKNMFADFNNQKQNLTQEKAKIEKYRELISKWTALSSKYEETKRGLFNDSFMFKKFVEKQAQNYGIRIETFRPTEKDMGFFVEGNIDLSFESTYREAVRFVSSMKEKNIKVIRITMNQSQIPGNVVVRLRLEGIIVKNGG